MIQNWRELHTYWYIRWVRGTLTGHSPAKSLPVGARPMYQYFFSYKRNPLTDEWHGKLMVRIARDQ